MSKLHLTIIYTLLAICLLLASYSFFKSYSPSQVKATNLIPNEMSIPRGDSVRLFHLPSSLSFADESVPIQIPDVKERLEREIYVNAYWQSNMILLLKRSKKFLPKIEEILKKEGVPDDFKYLAIAESGLMNVASPAGARGFWQFMDATGKEYGLEIGRDVDERYNLEKSTFAATKYLKKAHAKFGDWTAVAASYNMGQSGFARRQEQQLQKNYYDLYLNEETSRYMFRILAFKVIFENPKNFGFALNDNDYYTLPSLNTISINEDIKNLAGWASEQGSNYKELKLYNPWLRNTKLNVKRGKTYEILLPK